MIILIDTREKLPLKFSHICISESQLKKLDCGDYGCQFSDGSKSKYYFERKELGDLYGTLGKGYSRFKKEIQRARELGQVLILVVEGTLQDVKFGHNYSEIKPESIIKTMFTLLVRYGVYPVFCVDRREMTEFITQFYWAEERNIIAKKVLDKKGK